jgi:DNA-binding LacI/PurR family transcriptional regulator
MEALKESSGSTRISTALINVEKLPSDTGRLTGRILGENIIKAGKLPDAIFCPSDFLSFGIMDVMMGKGLTPGVDFKLISYDNLEGAGILPFGKPMITSVGNPRDSISRQAASLILNLEKHEAELTQGDWPITISRDKTMAGFSGNMRSLRICRQQVHESPERLLLFPDCEIRKNVE